MITRDSDQMHVNPDLKNEDPSSLNMREISQEQLHISVNLEPAISKGEKFINISDIPKYLEQFKTDDEKSLFKRLIENICVLDEDEFDKGITYLAKMIEKRVFESKQNGCVLLVDGIKSKSGALMLEKLLPQLSGFSIKVLDFADYNEDDLQKRWSPEVKNNIFEKPIFVLDDAAYSGARTIAMIDAAEELKDSNEKIHVCLVGSTKAAETNLLEMGTTVDLFVQLKSAEDIFVPEEYYKLSQMLKRGSQFLAMPSQSTTYNFLYYKVPDNFPAGLTREHPFKCDDGSELYLIDDTSEGIWPPYYREKYSDNVIQMVADLNEEFIQNEKPILWKRLLALFRGKES